ncbi:hypothetical protein [Aurantimonas marianensis]|uniref:Uncharacterized protein n=1 Tax=Aurantimonas marianensis TaxID=2920428 RepID=A0A9X2H832_9HYPH|nr:hypothetical protein [Aurantimonas marianensis]MCP3055250.1 hypothetical protein [Aurantimonas marianensis]
MSEIPPLDTVATATLAVGALFLLRYFLAMRRIWKIAGHRPSFQFGDYFRAMQRHAFGAALEPERRYAARQLIFGIVFAAAGLLLFAWLLATGAPVGVNV